MCELWRRSCSWPDFKVSLTSYLSVLQITSNRRVCSVSLLKSSWDESLCVHIDMKAWITAGRAASQTHGCQQILNFRVSYPILASAVRISRNPRSTERCILRDKYCTSKIDVTQTYNVFIKFLQLFPQISYSNCTYITAEYWVQFPEECDPALHQLGDEPLFIPSGYKREAGHSLSSKWKQTKQQSDQWDPREGPGGNSSSTGKHVGLCVPPTLL